MKWDAKKRRYVENGRVLREAEVRKRVDDYIAHEQRDVERRSEKLIVGALTVTSFFDYLRHKITTWHSLIGSRAYGGRNEMGAEQWARINSKILSELKYLNQFEDEVKASFRTSQKLASAAVRSLEVPAGLETLVEERVAEALLTAAPSTAEATARQAVAEVLADSVGAQEAQVIASAVQVAEAPELIGATIPSRAQMYTDAAYSTYENNVSAREQDAGAAGVRRVCENDDSSCDDCINAASPEYQAFEDVPDIGSLTCGHRDRCSFEFSYEGVEPLTVDRRLTG